MTIHTDIEEIRAELNPAPGSKFDLQLKRLADARDRVANQEKPTMQDADTLYQVEGLVKNWTRNCRSLVKEIDKLPAEPRKQQTANEHYHDPLYFQRVQLEAELKNYLGDKTAVVVAPH